MPATFTSTDFNYDQLVASETVSRSGILKSGAGIAKRGTILGLEVASGKYTKVDAAAVILAEDADATAADAAIVVYVQGKFLATSIVWPIAGAHSVHTALLQDAGIYILSAVNEAGLLVKPDTATVGLLAPNRFPNLPDGEPAAVTVTPTSLNVGKSLSGGSIAVTSPSQQRWVANSPDTWITISSPTAPVLGDGSVMYTIAANYDPASGLDPVPRTGSIVIGDQTVPVNQSAT